MDYVVGKEYVVPVVDIQNKHNVYAIDLVESDIYNTRLNYDHRHLRYFAVIGNQHNDFKYDFGEDEHLHYDFRFMEDEMFNRMKNYPEDPTEHYARGEGTIVRIPMYPVKGKRIVKTMMPKKCLRLAISVPVGQVGFMLETLQIAFKNRKINLDKPVCPHRKASLEGACVEDGCLVCPCHGLRWDMKTGKMKALEIPEYARNLKEKKEKILSKSV